MNKQKFMKKLQAGIRRLPEVEVKEILYDYEEHFSVGLQVGKTEEEIASELGDPSWLARQYLAISYIEVAEESTSTQNIIRAIVASVGLGFFNLVVVLGPFLAMIGIVIGIFAASIAMTVAGIAVVGTTLLYPIVSMYVFIPVDVTSNPVGFTALGIGVGALGMLLFLGGMAISGAFYRLTLRYLKMNVRVIRGEQHE